MKKHDPKTDCEKKFRLLFDTLQGKSKNIPMAGFHELIKLSKTPEDIRNTCLLFKIMVCKFYSFTTETSSLMTKMFLEAEMKDVAIETIKNSVLFKMDYSRETVYGQLISQLIKNDFENALTIFALVLDGKVRGIEEPTISDYFKMFSLFDLENEAHTAKIMELYEKMPKPKVPLVGFNTPLFIERLGKVYEILKVAAEKSGKDLEKVTEEKAKYGSYSREQVGSTTSKSVSAPQ
jgi:hypothetical protein